MPTTQRWWQHNADPNALGIETTVTDDEGTVMSVSGVMPSDCTEITEAAYDIAVAARDGRPDPRPGVEAIMVSDRDAIAAAAETAYNELVGNGYSSAAASALSGHTP